MANNLIKLEKALIEIKRDETTTLSLNTVLESKHSESIKIVENILKQRFLQYLLVDPDVYNAEKADTAFKLFKYFSPTEAEIFKEKKIEKDEYWNMKKDSRILQFLFKTTMKLLVAYIVARMIYESI
jgi:hypothetical protein